MANNKRPRKGRNSKSCENKTRNKKVEVNVDDSDVNAADLRPMEGKRRSKKGDNDYTWYNHYPELLNNVSGFNFGVALGSDLGIKFGGTTVTGPATDVMSRVPGICCVHYVPTVGRATGLVFASPINKVGTQLYAANRVDLGSTASYDSTDTTLYLLHMDSAFQAYALGVKIYGCCRMASPFNYYFMKSLLTSMGVDFESFNVNLSNFRSFLNQYAIYLSSYLVPADFDLYKRHMWLLNNIFTDSDTVKAQMYHYMIDGYYVYTEVTEGPSYCKYFPVPTEQVGRASSSAITFNSFQDMCNQLLLPLQTSQDLQQISADLGKVYGENVYRLSLIPEDYMTPIFYSEEVLMQLENTTLMGEVSNRKRSSSDKYYTWDIYQNVDLNVTPGPALGQVAETNVNTISGIAAGDASYVFSAYNANKLVVNMHTNKVSPEMNMVATRGMATSGPINAMDGTSQPLYGMTIDAYGSEIFTYAAISSLSADGSYIQLFPYVQYMQTYSSQLLSAWITFDWAPNFGACTKQGNVYRFIDMDNYAVIDRKQLEAMHETAILSELYSDKFPQARLNG